ncbi:MAG: tail fiber domain-containing protein [Bdellovibrionales bacterium]|nr:tail fiber domain-containing protein [Bdellovibrionales bacterium]
MRKYSLFFLVSFFVSAAGATQKFAQHINFDGVLLDPNTNAPITPNPDVKVQIVDPSGNCILFESDYDNLVLGSDGSFSIKIGPDDSIGVRNTSVDGNLPWERIFQSVGEIRAAGSTGCASGFNPFSASGNQDRKIRVSVNGTALSPLFSMSPAAMATVAQTLQGKELADFIHADNSGHFAVKSGKEVQFYNTSNSNFVALRAPSSITSNKVYDLPSADGSSGQVLTTNGSGVLSWTSPTATVSVGAGAMGTPSMTFSADTDTGLYNPASDEIGFTSGGVPKMIIKSDGKIGIGTTNPSVPLEVNGAVNATSFSGNGAGLTNLNASNLSSGTIPVGRLGQSGTPSATTFLRGDNTWQTVSGGAPAGSANEIQFRQNASTFGSSPDFRWNAANGSLELERSTTDKFPLISSTLNYSGPSAGGAFAIRGFATSTGATPQIFSGVYGLLQLESGGDPFNAGGVFHSKKASGSGTTSITSALVGAVEHSGGTTTNIAAGRFFYVSGAGNVDAYGVHIGNVMGTNKWSLYSTDSSAPSFFAGNVGVGTTDPSQKLHVVGNLRVQGSIDCTLGNGSGGTNCSSDIRLKTNVQEIENPLQKILSLRGVEFDWNEKSQSPGDHAIGVVAQDVEKVFPTAVIDDPNSGYKKVDYAALVAPVIQAFKEINTRITELSKVFERDSREITLVKAENALLKARADKSEADAAKQKRENAEIKARLDKIEKMLNSK